MRFFENWKISLKILSLIGLLSAVTVFVVLFGGSRLKAVEQSYAEIVEHDDPARLELVRFSRALDSIGYAGYRAIAYEGSSTQASSAAELVRKAFEAAGGSLKLAGELEPVNAATYSDFDKRLRDLEPVVGEALKFALANQDERAKETMIRVDGLIEQLAKASSELNTRMGAATKAHAEAASRSAHQAIDLNYLVGFAGLALCLVISLVVAKFGIAGPIQKLSDRMKTLADGDVNTEVTGTGRADEIGAMARAVRVFRDAAIDKSRIEAEADVQRGLSDEERASNEKTRAAFAKEQALVVAAIGRGLDALAKGALTFRISEPFPGEYEKLRDDFNAAMETLQETMKTIAGATHGIRSGTGEISQASDDLSKRTEQQAASLEETAAALDQITATVRKTAEGANHARDVVTTAEADAERSGEVVNGAVHAMAEIEKSAKQISNIIGVIDEIAFQTNLLALNAGVEAARAGEAGRGFAVVASEVRALAQRSAEAAKEIKTLIQASSTQVQSGVDLVGQTGKALARIVVQVAEINAVVSDIAASAKEQATGLAEVNTAVNQMDQVTQQNAAMVEQSTAASHSLAHEAEELGRLISRFEVGGDGTVSPASNPKTRSAGTTPRLVTAMKNLSGRSVSAVRKPAVAAVEESWEEF